MADDPKKKKKKPIMSAIFMDLGKKKTYYFLSYKYPLFMFVYAILPHRNSGEYKNLEYSNIYK